MGFYIDVDGMVRQFGTQKTIPEVGGDYLVYGSTREMEQLIPLVPYQIGNGTIPLPAPPTSFNGGSQATPPTSAIQAGIQSLTNLVPLQQTVPFTSSQTNQSILITSPQIFIESVEVETLIGVNVGGSPTAANISVGLVAVQPGSLVATSSGAAASTFFQITPNPGVQILNAFPIVTGSVVTPQATTGSKTIYAGPQGFTFTGIFLGAPQTVLTGGGSWLGTQMPQVTSTLGTNPNGVNILPEEAYLSTIITFTGGSNPVFTNGLLKLRIRYTMYGGTNF